MHLTKLDTLEAAYLEAKRNGGAPGSDGETYMFTVMPRTEAGLCG